MSGLAWWQTLASGAAGGAFTLGGQWMRSRLDREQAREARDHDRAVTRGDRRDAFELEQLERARRAVPAFMKAIADYRQIEAEGDDTELQWAFYHSPPAVEYYRAKGELEEITAVILDDEVRASLNELLADATTYIGSSGFKNHMDYWARGRSATGEIGARIRELYGPVS